MAFNLKIPEIDENDITDIKKAYESDIFGNRYKLGNFLIKIIKGSEDKNIVFALNSQWGSGKTTFLKMWQMQCKSYELESIYFDAFLHDNFDDPFVALASALYKFFEETGIENNSLIDFKKAAAEIGKSAFFVSSQIALKLLTIGIIGGEEIEKIKQIKDNVNKATTSFLEEKISSYKMEEDAFYEFHRIFQEIAEKVQHKLIIIIDELDRCRPDFAIKLLEKIKHLFSVKNVFFILSINKEQLEESVKSVYGNGIDSSNYIHKFIDFELTLPRNEEYGDNDLQKYAEHLGNKLNVQFTYSTQIIQFIGEFAIYTGLSLRELEKMFIYIKLVKDLLNIGSNFYKWYLIIFLVFMKIKFPKEYISIRGNSRDLNQLSSNLIFKQPIRENMTYVPLLEKLLKVLFDESIDNNDSDYIDIKSVFQLGRPEVNKRKVLYENCKLLDQIFQYVN